MSYDFHLKIEMNAGLSVRVEHLSQITRELITEKIGQINALLTNGEGLDLADDTRLWLEIIDEDLKHVTVIPSEGQGDEFSLNLENPS